MVNKRKEVTTREHHQNSHILLASIVIHYVKRSISSLTNASDGSNGQAGFNYANCAIL